jgi:hypothetical protein
LAGNSARLPGAGPEPRTGLDMSEELHQSPDPGPDPSAGGTAPFRSGIAPEVSRRVSAILDAVEAEAAQLREDAREEARRYLDYSRRRGDALLAERQRRISELSDELMSKAEAVVGRLDDAAPVRENFENLVRALGATAARLSEEAEGTRPEWEPPAFHDEAVAESQPPPVGTPPAVENPGIDPPAVAGSGAPDPGFTTSGPAYGTPPGPAFPPAATPQPPAQGPPAGPAPPQQGPPEPAGGQPHPSTHAREPAQPAPVSPLPGGAQAEMRRTTGDVGRSAVDDARLIAIQMAASGRTRRQVREDLNSVMGVTDTGQLLDEIFGAGSAEDARAI